MYRVQEVTGELDDPSSDQVVQEVLERADDPESHLDPPVRDAVDRFGREAVEECVRLIVEDEYTHRQAGAHAFGDSEYLFGIGVGVAAAQSLRELRDEYPTR